MTSAKRPQFASIGAVLLGLAIALVLSWTNVGVMELGTLVAMILPVAVILAIAYAGYRILVGMQAKLDRIESQLELVDAHDVA